MNSKMRDTLGHPKIRIECWKCGATERHYQSSEFVIRGWRIVDGLPICPICRRKRDIYAEFEEYFQEIAGKE